MREIKFRAWSIEGKQMLMDAQKMYDGLGEWFDNHGKEIDCYENFPTSSFGSIICEAKEGKIILMQFTGLKDKNGKEIWEGDLVSCYHPTLLVEDRCVGKVTWHPIQHSKTFAAWYVQPKDKHAILMSHDVEYEVIGNIYENTELLSK